MPARTLPVMDLLGHLLEMCNGSKVSATIEFNAIPFIKGVYELAQKGFIPGGTKRNLEYVSSQVNFSENIYPRNSNIFLLMPRPPVDCSYP